MADDLAADILCGAFYNDMSFIPFRKQNQWRIAKWILFFETCKQPNKNSLGFIEISYTGFAVNLV